jgi:hypothetical protein
LGNRGGLPDAGLDTLGGIVPKGWRDIFGHVVACQLARIFDPRNLYREIIAHVRLMLPPDYVTHDLAGHCATLMALARDGAAYRYGKARMIEMLQITPAEEHHMAALISDAEGKRRDTIRQREKRRVAGLVARAEYEAAAIARRSRVAELREQGFAGRAIADRLGITEGEVRRLTGYATNA